MHYKATEFNCRPNSLKKIKAGEYTIKGNNGKIYDIEKVVGVWYVGDCEIFDTMLQCLDRVSELQPTKPQPKVTYTDQTNAEVKRLRAENKELGEAVDKLEDLSIEMDNKIQSLEGELSLQVTYKEQARANERGRVGQIRKLESACSNHKLTIAQLEKQLSIWEFWMERCGNE